MAPSQQPEERKTSATRNVAKLAKLPSSAKVTKRPLMRPAIASPWAGKDAEKVVYVSHKMPFMAGIARVQSLIKHSDKREIQSVLESRRRSTQPRSHSATAEPVLLRATGKAIAKALQMAHHLQKQPQYRIQIFTSSVDAIDDIEVPENEDEDMDGIDDLPEARIRSLSVVEIEVFPN